MIPDSIARLTLPALSSSTGRFIQVYVDGEAFLITARESTSTRLILQDFLERAALPFEWGYDATGKISPMPQGTHYYLAGAGLMKKEGNTFLLSGGSHAYNKANPNALHLKDITKHLPDGLKLEIIEE
jgi:hypothetical protein